ncbi:uncharacterized protein [Rutidosis leptorrhynchoides]|uniref:uncharacterized protein isoform X2 n=1 Tax=Rutidosis leptorrhynchoides TaxID=125765 RepID=UPI003A98E017
MVDGKKGVLALDKKNSVKELINEFQTNCKKLSKCFPKPSLSMEAAVTTIKAVVPTIIKETCIGGAMGLFTESVYRGAVKTLSISIPSTKELADLGDYRPLIQSFLAGKNLEHVRNLAVVSGVYATVSCLSRKIRGKEDDNVETCMLASFGAGVALSLVTGMRGPSVISLGVFFALVDGAMYQAEQSLKPQPKIIVDAKKGVVALDKELINDHELQTNFKQASPVAAAAPIIDAVARCTAIPISETCVGCFFGLFTELLYKNSLKFLSLSPPSSTQLARLGEYRPLVQSFLAGASLEHVRNFAVLSSVSATITCLAKEIRGKEDVQTCIVAGFASGVAISLVTGMRGPGVISVGVICALMNGGMYKYFLMCRREVKKR